MNKIKKLIIFLGLTLSFLCFNNSVARGVECQKVQGGEDYENAVQLKGAGLYCLNHHQKAKSYDYFFVNIKEKQSLIISLETPVLGIRYKDTGELATTTYPYAGFEVYNVLQEKLGYKRIIATPQRKESLRFPDLASSSYYILLGTDEAMSEDVVFDIKLYDQRGDAGYDFDAASTTFNASVVELNKSYVGYISKNDQYDTYCLKNIPRAGLYSVSAVMNDRSSGLVTLNILNESFLEKTAVLQGGKEIVVSDISMEEGEDICIEIKHENGFSESGEYGFKIYEQESVGISNDSELSDENVESVGSNNEEEKLKTEYYMYLIGIAIFVVIFSLVYLVGHRR